MATWNDVRRAALELPETTEEVRRSGIQWRVHDRLFVWERPLRQADLDALGDAAPDGDVLAARVPHEVAKAALCADDPDVYFTTPHFDGYPAVLVCLERIERDELQELITEAWLTRAPERLVRDLEGGSD